MLRVVLLALGFLTFIGLVWHIGPIRILDVVRGLGPLALVLVLLPSLLMYLLEAAGWRVTLGGYAARLSFLRLFAIRTAGEVVNMTTPTAYLGGEPLKAYLLTRHGVPVVEGMASVITAKTTMTVAEVLFIVTGLGLAFWTMGRTEAGDSAGGYHQAGPIAFTVVMLVLGAVLLVVVQRRGFFTGLLGVLRRLRLRISFLESREDKLRVLDRAISGFYQRDQRSFRVSVGLFFLGWLTEALEVYVILNALGERPADFLTSVSIGALAVVVKGGAFFIPGSLGAQEGGNLLVLMAYGYSDVAGITFAILRRIRELVWIAGGLGCLAALGGFRRSVSDEPPMEQAPR
ncbi:flippase-like domain-containing protein [Candidatus Nitrospira bockiana]